MALIRGFTTDAELRKKGAPVRLLVADTPGGKDAIVYVRPINYGPFIDKQRALLAPYTELRVAAAEGDASAWSSDRNLEVIAPAVAEELVTGWEGFEDVDEKGKRFEIQFSVATCTEWLLDPNRREFYDAVMSAANRMDTFRAKGLKAAEKNSGKPSGGT